MSLICNIGTIVSPCLLKWSPGCHIVSQKQPSQYLLLSSALRLDWSPSSQTKARGKECGQLAEPDAPVTRAVLMGSNARCSAAFYRLGVHIMAWGLIVALHMVFKILLKKMIY